ncbi:hypothetical protein V6N12_046925 [Hibiscus sabdariffa]|uniref:Uncharacterized protein n=1 Tax=Hibiscus sabdariffa TaxID=183260 RepID=A0ABR2BC44_9ROSI
MPEVERMVRKEGNRESGDQDQKPNIQRKVTDVNQGLTQEEDDLVTRKENKEKGRRQNDVRGNFVGDMTNQGSLHGRKREKGGVDETRSSSDSESKVDGQGAKKEGVLNYRDAVEESSGVGDSDKDKGGPTYGPKRNIDYGANIGDMDQAEQVLDVTGHGVNPVLGEKAQVSWADRIDHLVNAEHGLSPGDEGGVLVWLSKFSSEWKLNLENRGPVTGVDKGLVFA